MKAITAYPRCLLYGCPVGSVILLVKSENLKRNRA